MNKQKLINIAKANRIKYYYDYNKCDLQKRILGMNFKEMRMILYKIKDKYKIIPEPNSA